MKTHRLQRKKKYPYLSGYLQSPPSSVSPLPESQPKFLLNWRMIVSEQLPILPDVTSPLNFTLKHPKKQSQTPQRKNDALFLPTNRGFQVVVRTRPLLEKEPRQASGEFKEITIGTGKDNYVFVDNSHHSGSSKVNGKKGFQFDRVFRDEHSNRFIYEQTLKPMLGSIFKGYNATIFAYGITGSGKTYTMFGDRLRKMEENIEVIEQDTTLGISFIFIEDLFRQVQEIEKSSKCRVEVKMSYMEIYNQQIIDLLNKEAAEGIKPKCQTPNLDRNNFSSLDSSKTSRNTPLRNRNTGSVNKTQRSLTFRDESFSSRAFLMNNKKRAQRRSSAAPPLFVTEDADGTVILPNLTQYKVKNQEEVMFLIIKGNMERTVAQTQSNLFSSRSHAIVQFSISQHFVDTERVLHSKISLIDLAGSQRANYSKGEETAQRMFEGSNINKSLLALANCIKILANPAQRNSFIPYRDSKLTRLLKDSLGGATQTLMIACVSLNPEVKEETINTIQYASRARQIKKQIKANVMLQDGGDKESVNQVRELQGELQELRRKLKEREEMIEQMKKCLERDSEKSSLDDQERSSPGKLMKKLKRSNPKRVPIQLVLQKKTEESIDDIPTIKGGTFQDHFLESSFIASDACTTQMFQNKRHVMSETELREANLGICNQMLHTLAREEVMHTTFQDNELRSIHSSVNLLKQHIENSHFNLTQQSSKAPEKSLGTQPESHCEKSLEEMFLGLEKRIQGKDMLEKANQGSNAELKCFNQLREFVNCLVASGLSANKILEQMESPENAYNLLSTHPRLSSLVASDIKAARFLANILSKFSVEQKMAHRNHQFTHSTKNPFFRKYGSNSFFSWSSRKNPKDKGDITIDSHKNERSFHDQMSSFCSNYDFTMGTDENGPSFMIHDEQRSRQRSLSIGKHSSTERDEFKSKDTQYSFFRQAIQSSQNARIKTPPRE